MLGEKMSAFLSSEWLLRCMKPRSLEQTDRLLLLLLLLQLPLAMVSFTLLPSSSLRIQQLSTRLCKPAASSSIWLRNPSMTSTVLLGSNRWQSSLKSSDLAIGMKVSVSKTGQKGTLIEKLKSGWWKCQLHDNMGNIMQVGKQLCILVYKSTEIITYRLQLV